MFLWERVMNLNLDDPFSPRLREQPRDARTRNVHPASNRRLIVTLFKIQVCYLGKQLRLLDRDRHKYVLANRRGIKTWPRVAAQLCTSEHNCALIIHAVA